FARRLPLTRPAPLPRANFGELPRLVDRPRAMGLDGTSFLPADVSSSAFGRDTPPDPAALALDAADVEELEATVERTIAVYAGDFESGFIAESPDKLRRLGRYYAALCGVEPFPAVSCHAPWWSGV